MSAVLPGLIGLAGCAMTPEAASPFLRQPPPEMVIHLPPGLPALAWGASQLQDALATHGAVSRLEFGEWPSTNPAHTAPPQLVDAPGSFQIRASDRPAQELVQMSFQSPESYAIDPVAHGLHVHYADEVGGMYALLDLAERVRSHGVAALALEEREGHAPRIAFRAVNPFLSIPLADESGDRDWEHWWFVSEEFWRGYLDLLAQARINWIDLHGMYDIQRTSFPNIWPYFVVSEHYPDVGVEPEQARKNLAMLRTVCRMARERGIRVALMNYTGGWNWPGCRSAPQRGVEDFIAYTREGLKQIVQTPAGQTGLSMIGFRIGESGYGEDFYARSYVAALEELSRPLPLYTRTWGARKDKLMELGRMYPGQFIIEIKYNGEQLGPPWHVAGGRMAGWRDYSYQDYLFYPRAYDVVWQIRANGTHRVFQWAGFEHIRECVTTCNLAGSIGFCVEPQSAYYPVTDFLHPEPLYTWEHERNALQYLMWGRLAYDPQMPQDVFRQAARRHWGQTHGDAAYDLLQSLSRIVPLCKLQYSLGPDHRDHAVELEWGGSLRRWAYGQPFDTFTAMGPAEYAGEHLAGRRTGRRTPLQTADELDAIADQTRAAAGRVPQGASKPLDDLLLDAQMTSALANYYAARLRAATAYAMADLTGDVRAQPELERLAAQSRECWQKLAELGDRRFRPFIDTLRMHTQTFLWTSEAGKFERDAKDLATLLVSDVPATIPTRATAGGGVPSSTALAVERLSASSRGGWFAFRAKVESPPKHAPPREVRLLIKPFRSESDWQRLPMVPMDVRSGAGRYLATTEVSTEGALYGLEIVTATGAVIAPICGARPYGVIDPWTPADAP